MAFSERESASDAASARRPRAVAAVWLLIGALAASVVLLGDAAVALGVERFAAVAVLAAHLAVGGLWSWRALRRPGWGGVGLALLPAVALLAVVWVPAVPHVRPVVVRAGARGPTVVLVTLDTFRADHLGALSGLGDTPNLDALAATGFAYEQAFACAPLTAPSHACLLTGHPVPEHGLRGNGGHVEAGTIVPTIAARGYRTGAFLSARVLSRESGLDSGFAHYDDAWTAAQRLSFVPVLRPLGRWGPLERSGDATVRRALVWLASDAAPAFLWVHLYEPHVPYAPDAGHAPSPERLERARASDHAARLTRDLGDVEGAHAAEGRLLYEAEVATVDAMVGHLLDGLPSDAVVVVVGDHGESLGEHGYWFNHGALLHDPALHVPLLVRWPGRGGAVRVPGLVATTRVAAILDAATGGPDVDLASADAEVVAYTPGQQNRRPPAGAVGRHTAPTAAIRFPTEKVVARKGDSVAFFDLATDPGELSPLAVPPARTTAAARASSLALPGDETDAEQLRALGYVE